MEFKGILRRIEQLLFGDQLGSLKPGSDNLPFLEGICETEKRRLSENHLAEGFISGT